MTKEIVDKRTFSLLSSVIEIVNCKPNKKLKALKGSNIELSKRIANDLDINIPSELSDEEMIDIISVRVEQMLKGDPDLLMSYLYRLDVLEKKIKAAMMTSIEPAPVTFAKLIWERQKQRILTKEKYKQDPIEGWEF